MANGQNQEKRGDLEAKIKSAPVQDDAEAQYRLAYDYEEGIGVNKDVKEAVRLYRLAANRGHAKAQNSLACAGDRYR